MASISLFQSGLAGDGRIYLIAFVICINGLTDLIPSIIGSALAIITMVILSVLSTTDVVTFSQTQAPPTGQEWTFAIFVMVLISAVTFTIFSSSAAYWIEICPFKIPHG